MLGAVIDIIQAIALVVLGVMVMKNATSIRTNAVTLLAVMKQFGDWYADHDRPAGRGGPGGV